MSAEREIFETALLTQRVASRFVAAQEGEEAFEKAFYYLGDQLKAGLDPKYGYDKLVEIEKGYNPFSWGLSAQVENVTGHSQVQLGISGEQIYLTVNRKKFAQAAIRPDKPLLPQFKKFVDRGVTMYFKKMFYPDFLRVLDEHEESQRLVEEQQQEVKKQRVESEEAEAKEAQARVTGIKERPDLKPVPRGWSTNPNSYGVPTFYEVLGENLSASSQAKVTDWLKQNRKNLTPGRHHGSYGQLDEVSLDWDPRQGAWIIVSRYWYTGD